MKFQWIAAFLLCLGQISAAEIAGVWTGQVTFRIENRDMVRDVTLILKTDGSSLTGTVNGSWEGHHDSTTILDGKTSGNDLSFAVATGAQDFPRMEFAGKQDGDRLTLTVVMKNLDQGREQKVADAALRRTKQILCPP